MTFKATIALGLCITGTVPLANCHPRRTEGSGNTSSVKGDPGWSLLGTSFLGASSVRTTPTCLRVRGWGL